jgi:hypothetical protein
MSIDLNVQDGFKKAMLLIEPALIKKHVDLGSANAQTVLDTFQGNFNAQQFVSTLTDAINKDANMCIQFVVYCFVLGPNTANWQKYSKDKIPDFSGTFKIGGTRTPSSRDLTPNRMVEWLLTVSIACMANDVIGNIRDLVGTDVAHSLVPRHARFPSYIQIVPTTEYTNWMIWYDKFLSITVPVAADREKRKKTMAIIREKGPYSNNSEAIKKNVWSDAANANKLTVSFTKNV